MDCLGVVIKIKYGWWLTNPSEKYDGVRQLG
jgi:hypothetical protein